MPDREIDVRAEMDGAALTRFHWLLIGLVFVAIAFDGYDILAPSYVIHFVGKAWALSPSQQGFLVSAGLIGVAIGSLSHGVIADRFGRRPTMIGGLLVSGVFSLVTAMVADSYGSFVLLRLVTGLGLGVIMPLGTAYINEYLPDKTRFGLATLAAAGFSIGGVGASVIGILFSQQYGWQVLFYVGAGAGVVGLVFLAVFPESTEYLVAHGRTEEAARLMARLRPDRAALYRDARFAEIRPAGKRARADWRVPLSRPFLVSTIALWVSSFLLLFVNYGLTAWTPNLMVARGDGFALGFGFGAALHSVPFVGGIVCGYLADRWLGRRGALALWCGLGALTTLSMVVTYHPILNIIAIAFAGFFLIGGQFMLNNTCAMTYPVHARGTGTGFMLGFGRFGGILGPYIGGALLGAFGTPDVLFIAAATAGTLAMACAAFIARPGVRPAAPAEVAAVSEAR
ncbi:MFS transporter [Pseudonocardia acaciae]|uniref:MFS transporter n=1 Tax=Pseudonocardia acaciae TaxID=551276 RepID=UPI000684996D|nr:MFS transporter [Pseudonocardia acaciae]